MRYQNPDIESSYRQNDIGKKLYELVLTHKPQKIVEFGTLYGYSAVAMAMALDELGEGHITAYDLFDEYPYKHAQMEDVTTTIDSYGLGSYITLKKRDWQDWLINPDTFDLLHVDISNTGETYEQLYQAVQNQIEAGAVVICEGGSKERDQVEWMTKYNKKPIQESGVPYEVIEPAFPSLSRLKNPV